MIIVAQLLVLIGLIWLLLVTDRPFLCSGLYAAVALALNLALGASTSQALVSTAIAWALASLYFWLLYKLQSSVLWWAVLIAGLVLGVV